MAALYDARYVFAFDRFHPSRHFGTQQRRMNCSLRKKKIDKGNCLCRIKRHTVVVNSIVNGGRATQQLPYNE